MTSLVERGHGLAFLKSLDLISFRSLSESSQRVWQEQEKFETRQMMIAAQGTAKALKDFFKELTPAKEQAKNDAAEFNRKFGG